MRFLCPKHFQHLSQLSAEQMITLWFEWINAAAIHYVVQQWREAAVYCGCAFELSMLYLEKCGRSDSADAATKICLSVVYLANNLEHLNESEKAQYALSIGYRALQNFEARYDDGVELEPCMQVMLDKKIHADYFEAHLNLPYERPLNQTSQFQHSPSSFLH